MFSVAVPTVVIKQRIKVSGPLVVYRRGAVIILIAVISIYDRPDNYPPRSSCMMKDNNHIFL